MIFMKSAVVLCWNFISISKIVENLKFHLSHNQCKNGSVILVRKIILVSVLVRFFINNFSFSSISALNFKIFSFSFDFSF